MWLIIRQLDNAVIGTTHTKPPDEAWNLTLFKIKEWHKEEPPIHDPEEGVFSYDPNYDGQIQWRVDFETLAALASSEINWLEQTIPNIPNMDDSQVRNVVHRLAQENLRIIKAMRYIALRLERR